MYLEQSPIHCRLSSQYTSKTCQAGPTFCPKVYIYWDNNSAIHVNVSSHINHHHMYLVKFSHKVIKKCVHILHNLYWNFSDPFMTPIVCHKIISQLVKIPFFTNTKGRLWLRWVFVMKYYARTSNHCQSVISSRAGAGGDCLSPVVQKPRIHKIYGKQYSPGREVTYHC